MDNTEGMWLDPANLSEITINGTALVVIAGMGATWYAAKKRKGGGDGDRDA